MTIENFVVIIFAQKMLATNINSSTLLPGGCTIMRQFATPHPDFLQFRIIF